MSSHSRNKSLVSLLLFFTILGSFAVSYSLSNSTTIDSGQAFGGTCAAGQSSLSSSVNDEVVLVKNNKLVVGKTCLDFKGLDDEILLIDLYLLDLDDEQSYTQRINRKKVGKEIRLGDSTYKMVSAKKRYVKLKVKSTFSTP